MKYKSIINKDIAIECSTIEDFEAIRKCLPDFVLGDNDTWETYGIECAVALVHPFWIVANSVHNFINSRWEIIPASHFIASNK